MSEDLGSLSSRQKIALAAAVGAGVLVGAGGLIVYQRLNQVSPVVLPKDCLGCCAGGRHAGGCGRTHHLPAAESGSSCFVV